MSPGILGKKIGMTQVFRAGRAGGSCHAAEGGTVRGGAAQDAHHRRLRCRAARLGGVRQGVARSTSPTAGHLKKASADGVKFLREVPLASRRRRFQAGRPGAGGSVQAHGQGGRDRRQQGPRVRRPRQAPSFPRRRRTSHGSMFHRAPGSIGASSFPVARVSRHAHGRPHGRRSR